MRIIIAALSLFVATAAAAAQTYAVMSVVGDGLLVVQHRPTTGSSLEGNVREFLPISNPALDRAVLLAVDDAVRRADPSARTVLVGGRDAGALEAQSRTLGKDDALQIVVDTLRPHLPSTGATRLILVAKSRHAARISLGDGSTGSGSLEGLGYYLDPTIPTARGDTGEAGYGLLAPFAYFTVALVDLQSGKILAERPVYASYGLSQARSDTLSAWEVLTPEQKVRNIESLIRAEIARAVPALLDAR